MAIRQVTPPQAQTLLQSGSTYIDVRTEAEFAAGHPAGAVNIPIAVPDARTGQMAINPDFVPTVQAHYAAGAALVIGCQSGMRSQRAAEVLEHAGFSNVVNMQGGFGGARDASGRVTVPGWKDSNLPLCTACAPEATYAALRRRT